MKILIIANEKKAGTKKLLGAIKKELARHHQKPSVCHAALFREAMREVRRHADTQALVIFTDALGKCATDFPQSYERLGIAAPYLMVINSPSALISTLDDPVPALEKAGAQKVFKVFPSLPGCLFHNLEKMVVPEGKRAHVETALKHLRLSAPTRRFLNALLSAKGVLKDMAAAKQTRRITPYQAWKELRKAIRLHHPELGPCLERAIGGISSLPTTSSSKVLKHQDNKTGRPAWSRPVLNFYLY